MKTFYYIAAMLLMAMMSCTSSSTIEQKRAIAYGDPIYFGKHITEEGAIDCSELKDLMGASVVYPAKVKGEVIGVCPDQSCALLVDLGDGTSMNVKMANSKIEIPKDVNGKIAILEGKAYIDTSAVKLRPGYNSDSGRSIAETEATKNPEVSLAFYATGLIIK